MPFRWLHLRDTAAQRPCGVPAPLTLNPQWRASASILRFAQCPPAAQKCQDHPSFPCSAQPLAGSMARVSRVAPSGIASPSQITPETGRRRLISLRHHFHASSPCRSAHVAHQQDDVREGSATGSYWPTGHREASYFPLAMKSPTILPVSSTFHAPTMASGGTADADVNAPAMRYTHPPGFDLASVTSSGSGEVIVFSP